MGKLRILAGLLALAALVPSTVVAGPASAVIDDERAHRRAESHRRELVRRSSQGALTVEDARRLHLRSLAAPPSEGGSGMTAFGQATEVPQWRFVVGRGRFDADAFDDVLLFEGDLASGLPTDHATGAIGLPTKITALSGAAGTVLWSRATMSGGFVLIDDVTGDGRSEILLHELQYLGATAAFVVRQRVTLIAPDGRAIWTKEADGQLVVAGAVLVADAIVIGARSLIGSISLVDDGTGEKDTFLATYDFGRVFAFALAGGEGVDASRIVSELVDSGGVAEPVTSEHVGEYAMVYAVPDISGDSRPDLIRARQPAASESSIDAVSMDGSVLHWTRSIRTVDFLAAYDGDGAGVPELYARHGFVEITALSGATGETLWEKDSADDPLCYLVPSGTLDSVAGDDFVGDCGGRWDPHGFTSTVAAFSGKTGLPLYGPKVIEFPASLGEAWSFSAAWMLGVDDYDGDGGLDWLGALSYYSDFCSDVCNPTESVAKAVSGATGATLWELSDSHSADGLEHVLVWGPQGFDGDGDGADDVVSLTRHGDVATVVARKGLTGVPLFIAQLAVPDADNATVYLWPANVAGGTATELVAVVEDHDNPNDTWPVMAFGPSGVIWTY